MLKRELKLVEILTIAIHLMTCIFLSVCYSNNLLEVEKIKKWTDAYFFILPLFLIGIQFRKLRNIKYYIIWLAIGIVQLYIYKTNSGNSDFSFINGNALDGLKALFPVLVIFQIFRQISIRVYKREMIISIRRFRMSFYEEEDKRNMTWIDVTFSFLLFMSVIIFNTI